VNSCEASTGVKGLLVYAVSHLSKGFEKRLDSQANFSFQFGELVEAIQKKHDCENQNYFTSPEKNRNIGQGDRHIEFYFTDCLCARGVYLLERVGSAEERNYVAPDGA
jgi:hypothetical protein